jgi:hypothetical protein
LRPSLAGEPLPFSMGMKPLLLALPSVWQLPLQLLLLLILSRPISELSSSDFESLEIKLNRHVSFRAGLYQEKLTKLFSILVLRLIKK